MKRLNIMSALLFVLGIMASCSDDHDLRIAPEENFVAPVLKAVFPENTIFTEETDMNSNLGYVLWEPASYGYSAPVKYILQADTAGGDFTSPIEVVTSNTTEAIITAKILNNTGKNYTTKIQPVTLDLRLKTMISSIDFDAPTQTPLYSNIQSITFTPYISEIPMKAAYYLVGDALVGWGNEAGNIGADLQPFFAANNDMKEKMYSFTGYFQNKGFKLITTPGGWDDAYGFASSAASGNLGVNNTGDNFNVGSAGYYTFTADFSSNTYTMQPFDASSAPKYEAIGIIGDATAGGWDKDTPMTLVTGQEHLWVLQTTTLNAGGGLKFRANGSWESGGNWGTGTIPFGVAENSGGSGNITIENGGEYFIEFNDLTGEYIIMPLKNAQKK